jgi:hypothetical protein
MRTSPGLWVTPPPRPSAACSPGVRVNYAALRHRGWPLGDLPGEDPARSARRRWSAKARPHRAWRASWSRAHAPRAGHPSSPVPVRRPARVDAAAFRPRLATTPLPCSSPSASRTPGTRTFPSLVLCHARHTRPKLSGAVYRVRSSAWLGLDRINSVALTRARASRMGVASDSQWRGSGCCRELAST